MFITSWQRLGISPTRNEDAIREAYVREVKKCHPEEKSEEWALLHDAYLQALRYARGDSLQSDTAQQAGTPPDRDRGPEPEYSEDFRAALQKSQETAERVMSVIQVLKKKRAPVTARQVQTLTQMLFELRPGSEADKQAAAEALRFFSSKLFTLEAYTVICGDLQEWNNALPQTEFRTELQAAIRTVERLRAAGEAKHREWKDAAFAWCAAVICLLVLLVSIEGGAIFGVIFGAFCFGMDYRLKTKERLYIPRERGAYRVRRTILALVLLLVFLGMQVGIRYYARQGLGKIEEQVEDTYAAFSPELSEGTSVYAKLNGEPAVISSYSKTTEVSVRTVSGHYRNTVKENGHYYLCEDEAGNRLLLYVSELNDAEFRKQTGTVYGRVEKLPYDGLFIPAAPLALVETDVESVLQSLRETKETIEALGSEIGGNPVIQFTGTEPEHHTVFIGYEPGHTPYVLCWSIGFGCAIHLILMLSRSVAVKKTLFEK